MNESHSRTPLKSESLHNFIKKYQIKMNFKITQKENENFQCEKIEFFVVCRSSNMQRKIFLIPSEKIKISNCNFFKFFSLNFVGIEGEIRRRLKWESFQKILLQIKCVSSARNIIISEFLFDNKKLLWD